MLEKASSDCRDQRLAAVEALDSYWLYGQNRVTAWPQYYFDVNALFALFIAGVAQ